MNWSRWSVVGLGLLVAAGSGCKRERQEAVREELSEAGYEMTPEAYFRAAESEDVEAMRRLLEGGVPLEVAAVEGSTALHAAARAGAEESIEFLLQRGLPVDVRNHAGRTPLMDAVLHAGPETVRQLLRQGADPAAKDGEDYKPLMLAVREGRPQMVAELAPYVRSELDDALLAAAILGEAEMIDELTNYGASIYARVEDGRTPLMLAAQRGREEAVEMLLEIGANRFAMDDQGRVAADLAREGGHGELAERLASEPVAGDFELVEPAELGVEMAEDLVVEVAVPVGDAPVEGGADAVASGEQPWNLPIPGQREGIRPPGSVPEVRELDGAVVGFGTPLAATPAAPVLGEAGEVAQAEPSGSDELAEEAALEPRLESAGGEPLVMRSYRQTELPIRVANAAEHEVEVQVAGASPVAVAEGSVIPGSRLEVVSVTRRIARGKEHGDEVSVVEVRDLDSGVARELVVGLPALAHDPVALVEDAASGNYYVARTGQRFRTSAGDEWVVADVRANQLVIQRSDSGETKTIPLRGPRG